MRGEDLQVDGLVADTLRAWKGGDSTVSLTAWQSVSRRRRTTERCGGVFKGKKLASRCTVSSQVDKGQYQYHCVICVVI